jgi:hypothetical protein
MDLYHLRQGLHVIASSWDYHGGAESRVSVRGNSVRFKAYLPKEQVRASTVRNLNVCTNEMVLRQRYVFMNLNTVMHLGHNTMLVCHP